jgi:hypothetical protein
LAKIKTEPKSKLDVIAETHPRYRDILVAHRDLLARQDALLAESAPLNEIERKQPAFVTQAPKPKPKPAVVRHAGAVALIGDLLPEQSVEEISPPAPRPNWEGEGRHREIGRELEAISEALKLLSPELTKARNEYSRLVATQRGAEYSELAERAVDAARELGAALLAMHNFVNDARLNGVERKYFRPLNLEAFGDLAGDYTPLRALILRAVELGHVGAGKLPDWKMPAPLDYLT